MSPAFRGPEVYSDDSWGNYNLYEVCNYFLDRNILLPIKILRSDIDDYSSVFTYPESGCFIKYLNEKYGCEDFKRLSQEGEGRVEQIFGKSFEDLEKEWIGTVKSYDAQEVNYKI